MTASSTSARRQPTQTRSEESVASILLSARRLLAQHEARDVTVRMVAEGAGVSPAAIYRYFRDIGDVVEALLTEHASIAESVVAEALSKSRHRTIASVFELIVRTYLDLYRSRPELAMTWRSSELADRQRMIEESSDGGLARTLAQHLGERGLIARTTPAFERRLAAQWVTTGAMIGVLLRADPSDVPMLEAELIALIRHFAARLS